MANEIEKACVAKENFHGLKVYRHDSYKETLSELRKAPEQSEIITVINLDTGVTHRFQDPARLSKALKAISAIPSAITELKAPMSETTADLFTEIQNNPSGSAAGAQNLHFAEALGDLDDWVTTVHTVRSTEVPNTPGDLSTLKSVSPGQILTVGEASTGFSDISTDIPESPATAEKGGVYEPSCSPRRTIFLNPKVPEKGGSPNPLPNVKSVESTVESRLINKADVALRPGPHTDKMDLAEVHTSNPTREVGSGSSKKKKKGSKRKTVHKGKCGTRKTAVSSSSQGNQDSNDSLTSLHQQSETPAKLNNGAQSGEKSNAVESQSMDNGKRVSSEQSNLTLTSSRY